MNEHATTTLVVIDDDPEVLRATARVLQQAGYTVITGASAAEAVALTRRHLPAILLLDVMMPDGNGVDVARQLKGEAGLAGVFVILLSGAKTSGEDQAVGLTTGLADGYIARPIGKAELLARIDAMLRLRDAQAQLREALGRLQKIASRVPGVVYQFRLRADGSSCLPFASEALRELYRLDPEEVREDAAKLFAVCHADDRPALINSIEASARDLSPWQHEYRVQFDDGSVRWLWGNALPEREADAAVLWHGFVTDITERKLAADELEQYRNRLEELVSSRTAELALAKDVAEAANLAKSTFLATMSHELRTPLNAILGLGYLVGRELAEPKLRGQVDKIRSAGQQLLGMVDQILDMTRLEADTLEIEISDFALQPVLDAPAKAWRERAAAKGLDFALEIDPALPPFLRGDPRRLHQMLAILADNAIKFSDHGRIALGVRLLSTGGDGLLLRFEVADQGIGIDATQLALLFTSFAQADSSTTRKYGGIGIGLNICKRLARLMGGEAGADSTPGAGSTFWFTVRLQRSNGSAAAAAMAHGLPGRHVETAAVQEAAAADATPLAADALRAVLDQLDALLAQSDIAAIALFEEHAAALRAALGEPGERLGHEIREFAFEAALETVQTLRKSSPPTPLKLPR